MALMAKPTSHTPRGCIPGYRRTPKPDSRTGCPDSFGPGRATTALKAAMASLLNRPRRRGPRHAGYQLQGSSAARWIAATASRSAPSRPPTPVSTRGSARRLPRRHRSRVEFERSRWVPRRAVVSPADRRSRQRDDERRLFAAASAAKGLSKSPRKWAFRGHFIAQAKLGG